MSIGHIPSGLCVCLKEQFQLLEASYIPRLMVLSSVIKA